MNEQIQDAIAKHLIEVEPAWTIITDKNWWAVRAWLIARDIDRTGCDLTMPQRLQARIN